VHDSTDWLWLTRHFAQRAAEQGRIHSGIYFEEHATDPKLPEWEVFQDEWASTEFNRFQEKPANWGVFSPSYHDFALYMANEWMKRGVSLYFDNTNPKRCYNPRFGPAYRSPDGTLRYGISLFGQRQYYRRIYKLLQETNAAGVEYPIDFTVHMTNTQTLPFNVWATATLDLEQRAYTEDPELVPPEVELGVRRFPSLGPHRILTEKMKQRQEAAVRKAAQKQGYQLPWPPDYTRTVTFGRQPGVIPLALDFVSGHGRHQANEYSPAILLRDWAMRRLHDIRPGAMYMATARLAAAYEKILLDSGYGQLEQVEEYNYWDPASPVRVTDERVKWMALKRKDRRQPEGLLLLQSYCRPEPVNTEVVWPGMNVLLDIETRELLSGKNGRFRVTMPENLSTRMFLAATQPAALQPLAAPENCLVEDFALAVPVHYDLTVVSLEGSRTKSLPAEFFPREDRPGKRFWRMPSSQRTAGLTFRDDWNLLEGNYLFSFRVRLPGEALVKLPEKATKSLLVLQWRVIPENKEKGIEPQMLQASLGCQRDGENFLWVVTEASAVKGKQQTPLLAEGQDKGKFIVLGQARPGQWVEIGLADRETECTFLFQGRPVSNVTVPEVWSGRLCLNQGKLLASGTVAYLDLTDLTVSWQP
ncbi:MAG TPA: hypothetical protein PKW42_02790, partial [bacterium]|nr:hypothetical protein [bacterium]